LLDRVVVVAPAGIDRDLAAFGIAARGERAVLVAVVHAEHDDAARLRPQHLRIAAPLGGVGEPAHIAVIAAADELAEILPRRLGEMRRGKPDRVEAHRQRLRPDLVADLSGHDRIPGNPPHRTRAPIPSAAFPAKAGTHLSDYRTADRWVPAFAGNAAEKRRKLVKQAET